MKLLEEIQIILLNHGLTISVAESLTSGMLQNKLASLSGASEYYKGGITAYNIETKTKLLNVDFNNASACDCVSEQTVTEMAQGVRELFDTSISIATTGFAESFKNNDPHAYYSICIMDEPPFVAKINLSQCSDRTEARVKVTGIVLKKMYDLLNEKFPPLEIEHKFHPSKSFDLNEIIALASSKLSIVQLYLTTEKDNATRVRIINDEQALITSKLENNIELESDFNYRHARFLVDSRKGANCIEKDRYKIDYKGLVIEVDVFKGRHSGIIVIEIEVPHKNYQLPKLPSWVDTENKEKIRSNAEMATDL